jgi:hypothetical protein
MATCRLCKKYEFTGYCSGGPIMVRYGPRHYACGTCAVEKWGAAILTKIHPNQLRNLPFMTLQNAGLLDQVRDRVAAWDKECAQHKGVAQ